MIEERTESEDAAISLFFDLLEQFHDRQERVVARLSGINKTFERNGRTVNYPRTVRLVAYTEDPGFFVYADSEGELPSRDFFPTIESFELNFSTKRESLTILDPSWNPIKSSR